MDTAFSPLDVAWELDEGLYSGALKQNMAWLCGLLPYGQAAEVMRRVGKRAVSDSSLWRLTQKVGRALQEQATQRVKDRSLTTSPSQSAETVTKVLSMDGGMVNIEGEGWKELKVGLVGTVIPDAPASADAVPSVHTTAAHYCAVLGDVSAFTPVLLDLARRTDFQQAERSCVTADGAAWIWNLADTHFPNSVQIVDYYHARQHLALAAQMLFPDTPVRADTWLHAQTDALFDGHLKPIVTELRQAGLSDSATYFQNHQSRMHYADFQDAGFPIGSGCVESEVKQFKHRLDGPGMYWSRQGAQHMILIRAAVLDGSFDMCYARAA